MKALLNVFFDSLDIDLSILEREKWLKGTGIYVEFIPCGRYDKQLDFEIRSVDGVEVCRYSWNRFFLNLLGSSDLTFSVSVDGKKIINKQLHFDVVNISTPLMLSVLSLPRHKISDIRFFISRLSESLINGTRFILFDSIVLEELTNNNFEFTSETLKFFDLLFSIITERGLTAYVTPFDSSFLYEITLVKELRKSLTDFAKRFQKYGVIYDFSSGLRKRELMSCVDYLLNRVKVFPIVPEDMVAQVGGEGFCGVVSYQSIDDLSLNERGIKIYRTNTFDFFTLRTMTTKAVKKRWGVEFCIPFIRNLRRFKYSLAKALYQGYADSK